MKIEEQNSDNPQNLQLNIPAISSNASNEFKLNAYISDDLEDLKRRYTPEDANELYKLILVAKENPTDGNIKNALIHLSDNVRIVYLTGLEIETGNVYIA